MSGSMRGMIIVSVLVALAPACSGSPQAPRDARAALSELLPANGEAPGWTRKDDVRFYGADNLWDFIDGGAEAYLACGFQDVVTSEYVNPAVPSGILVDIYRMREAGGALGIYSQERSPTGDQRRIGAEGYLSGTTVNFWANEYYVKLTAFQDRDDARAAMVLLAEAVSRRIGPPGPTPPSGASGRCGAGSGNR